MANMGERIKCQIWFEEKLIFKTCVTSSDLLQIKLLN